MSGMLRYKTSFPAQDANGNTHWLDVFVEILDARAMGNADEETEGLIEIKTRIGDFVNRLEKGKYEIVESGEILTSDHDEAP